ncbi:hypothetical protein MAE02_27810 [Microvirga aerophila]|uniref:Uncharacterized protein n=1 Tax=Microvirga aerophila TaxID=670291 RepID=A0A512BT53_9HYPH|nr:hypothetical protein MAE02_27810 [Microvirga aerophila]
MLHHRRCVDWSELKGLSEAIRKRDEVAVAERTSNDMQTNRDPIAILIDRY